METINKIRLTASEISNIWTTYMNDTMAICGLTIFLAQVKDERIRPIIEYSLGLSQNHVQRTTQIFNEENYPIPQGFTDNDIDLTAPRLFSDNLVLGYILNMAKYALYSYSLALSSSARLDNIQFYSECISTSIELHNRAKKLSLDIGFYVRSPYIFVPKQIDFVHQQSFLGNWFGDKRPLLAVEINNLAYNIKRNVLGKVFVIGFSQVAKSEEVRKYMLRGRELAQTQIDVFSSLLGENYLPAPMLWDSEVTSSTVSPFSDKLIMFHTAALTAFAIGQYGIGISTSPRSDLAAIYARLMIEVGQYANNGAKIMINNGWLEQPPQTVDREALAKV